MTIESILALGKSRLGNHQCGQIESSILLRYILGLSSAQLIANKDNPITKDAELKFLHLVAGRLEGLPIAYLTGIREFWSLPLHVNKAVLIPRHETETLVERALVLLDGTPNSRILELGTGCGAIALALASELIDAKLVATDVSAAALKVAQQNQENLNIRNICWIQSDWYTSIENRHFHLICSNPPYVAPNDPHLRQGDLRFEPIDALRAEDDGYEAIQRIISQAQQFLLPDGWLIVEHGYQQGQNVRDRFCEAGFSKIQTSKDLSGNDRITEGRIRSVI